MDPDNGHLMVVVAMDNKDKAVEETTVENIVVVNKSYFHMMKESVNVVIVVVWPPFD